MRPVRLARFPSARAVPAALVLAAAATGRAAAQNAPASDAAADPRWHAWYGCWSAAPDSAVRAGAVLRAEAPITCVTPAGGSAVDVTTVVAGKVAARDRVDASGAQRRFDRDGCAGWERGEWAADGRRVYLRSELTCANNVRRTGDGVLAFAAGGEWLDVRSATVGGYTGVRTVRHRPAPAPFGLPADVAAALKTGGLAVETARAAVSAPATTADVVDVSRRAGAPVAAAWLAELRQRFALDARQLVALADAGVPGTVTDVLVATSFPQRFALGPSGAERALREPRAADDALALGRPGPVAVLNSPLYGGWGWNAYGLGPFGYNAWAPGFGYGLGYYPRGGYWGSGPVVVVRPGPTAAGERPRFTPGRGFSQGDNPTVGSARTTESQPAPSREWSGSSPSMGSGGFSSGGASSGGASSSGASSGGGEARTAKPRP
jgi:uncharacterized membrane protein YgcG